MKYSINFRFKTTPTKKDKKILYVRLKINGVTATDFATSIFINPSSWSQSKQTIIGNSELDFTNRAMLLKTESDLIELIRANPEKSAKEIRNIFVGKELPPATLLNTYKRYIKEEKENLDSTPLELAKNTKQRWYNCLNHLTEFMKNRDLELSEIDIDFGKRLYLYLIKKPQMKNQEKKIGHDYAVRNVTYLNQVIDFAKRKRLIDFNVLDIEEFKRNPPNEIESLTAEQLQRLARFRLSGVLDDARNIFLLIAYSGVNYCDLKTLEKVKDKQIITLKIDRQKNEKKMIEKAIVPILPELRKVLEKYNYKLPNYHIDVINRHLHVFEGLLNAEINITTYTARKTAAMLLCERGVSIDVISKILGHTSIITTQRYYVKVSQKRVENETRHLHNNLSLN